MTIYVKCDPCHGNETVTNERIFLFLRSSSWHTFHFEIVARQLNEKLIKLR